MQRESWATRVGFVLAAMGSAIGLGNIWRFGYLVYKNGGGAFLIPYFVALFVAGISLLILEFALGHKFRGSAPKALGAINKKFEWIGWWAVLSGLIILTYYCVIIAQALVYFTKAFTLAWGTDTKAYYFGQVLQLSNSPWSFGGFAVEVLIATIVVWAVNWLIDFRGIRDGIEKANMILMPLLWILAIILVIRALTLPGAVEGIEWYLKPDFSKLMDYNIWLSAFGQIFFTLSLGMGIMIAYASYLPEKSDLANNAFIVAFANCAFSFLVGFAIFGTLGYMAYTTGSEIGDVVAQSIGLAFVVFPQALNLLPALRAFTAAVFFLSLVVAGLSSSISLVEAVVSAVMDKFDVERRKAVNIVVGIGFIGSLLYTTKAGLYWLDIIDHFVNYYGLVLVGLLETIAAAWFFNLSEIRNHVNAVSDVKVSSWWDFSVKFAVPIILLTLLALDIYHNLEEPYGGYPVNALIVGFSVILAGMLVSAILSWRDKDVS